MPAAARIGDTTTTGHGCDGTTTIIRPSPNVFVNSRGLERKGDPTAPHTIPSGPACVPHDAVINVGSPNVFTNSIPTARVGDSTDGGVIITGSPNVFINSGGGSAGTVDVTTPIVAAQAPGTSIVEGRVVYSNTPQGITSLIEAETKISPNLPTYHEDAPEEAPEQQDPTPPNENQECISSKYYKLVDSKMPIEAQVGLSKKQIECNWIALCQNILDPLRDAGFNFRINSGFRTIGYNRKIGSRDTSDHTSGCAVDISTGNRTENIRLFKAILNKLPYSQLIFEGNWVHIAYNGRSPKGNAKVMYTYTGSSPRSAGATGQNLPSDLQA